MRATTGQSRLPMTNVFYLVLRRMRVPLIIVTIVYTVCTSVLALVPGVDADGQPTPGMGLFHAFYVISYTGTTIGFGEIPVPYSGAQRLWLTVSIYATVIGWSFSIVNLLALLQDPGLQNAVRSARFNNHIRGMREPFYIVAGCGETGAMVCHGLDRVGLRFVIIEPDPVRFEELRLEQFSFDPPMARSDASQADSLIAAGLLKPNCRGVMALAPADETNLDIAVNVGMLRRGLPTLARIQETDMDTAHGVFLNDIVVNPFERFAEHLVSAIIAPERYLAREILTGLPGMPLPEAHHPPAGHWVMCGYGRFGHAITEALRAFGLTVSVIDHSHYDGGQQVDIKGRGTEPGVLAAAGIEHANGIVAGHRDDRRNLAIAAHARELNPDIFIVTRQNQRSSAPLFEAFEGDLAMEPSKLVAREFLAVITTPLLARYLAYLRNQDEPVCSQLVTKLSTLRPGYVPETWSLVMDEPTAPAVVRQIREGVEVTVGHLMADPRHESEPLWLKPLVHARDDKTMINPGKGLRLAEGDEVLFVGSAEARRRQEFTLVNDTMLTFVITGEDRSSGGLLWRWMTQRRAHSAARS
ncbi:NAD-binding protein [Propioniciclava soli]|uniref:NAD-binding protein n=1 Tax=Propioniciclava soli TaxID=2775081 RepID=UPI001E576861|nr:NAD-binding protein [Propioniciclava soli]